MAGIRTENAVLAYPGESLCRLFAPGRIGCMPTPKFITVRRMISRETIEKLHTEDEIFNSVHLSSQLGVKPQAQWFFCVFVFSVARESPSTLRIRVLSTTVIRTHKYMINAVVLHVAPEITLKEEHGLWVDVIRAHFKAEDRLTLHKMHQKEMSNYTRHFMDNGAADAEPLEFVISDWDYDSEKKLGPVLVQ